jgi:SNF2 family DNA or RNA helicase
MHHQMEGVGDDPYSWDIGVVADRLSGPGYPWSRDPESLAARIRDEEIDGKTLLTFEHVCSRQELMECLGIKIARHKAALVEAIVTLRSKSKGYWQWQQDFQRKQSSFWNEEVEPPMTGAIQHASSNTVPNEDGKKESETSSSVPFTNGALPHALKRPAQSVTDGEIQMPSPQEDPELPTAAHAHQPPVHESSDQVPEMSERSNKRKRVAPMLLTEEPRNVSAAFIPTEADVLNYTMEQSGLELGNKTGLDFQWEDAPAWAYLGGGMLPKEDIISPVGTLSSFIIEAEDSFAIKNSHILPPATRIVANRFLKRLFTGRYRISKHSSRSPSFHSDQSDKILELADLDTELDAETLREIEEEELENERLDALADASEPDPFVSPERIAEILNEAIAAMEDNWRQRKLPKYERKAYSLWQKSRRHGTRKLQIQQAHKMANRLIERIGKICLEIQDQDWTIEASYRDAAKSLEQSLEDKMYQTWLINMLELSKPPPKPQGVPRPKPVTVRQPQGLLQEEVLTSSDEEDFILLDDHMDIAVEDGHTGGNWNSPIDLLKEESDDSDAIMDLTQDDMDDDQASYIGFDVTNPIDLTSPAKSANSSGPREPRNRSPISRNSVPETALPESQVLESEDSEGQAPVGFSSEDRDPESQTHDLLSEIPPASSNNFEPPPIEHFGNLQQVASQSPKRYARQKDRWRLLITEMWHMEHARRKAAVDLILSDHHATVWDTHIAPYLLGPLRNAQQLDQENHKVVLFDVTRLCYCFFMCQHTTEELMLSYQAKKMRKRLNNARVKLFEPLCTFVGLLTSHFPQDSQIYRQDTDILDDIIPEEDDELDDLDNIEEEEDNRRQRPKEKEIIRDKAAVDLRERENQRIQEQEARRKKLRAALASHGLASGEGTRLIINESKEEDQSLIYVNEHIGPRIKNHQIDGVRFLWNQIVRDSSIRQGCLLAHTMGLGKTMQVITVLVALAEATESKDPSVVAQIPEDLRDSRTLVLCPAALVDNWMDEFLKWAPENLLGELRKVTASMTPDERASTVSAWASGKGVLLAGYQMFQKLLDLSDDLEETLVNRPDVVICDEAHYMKNRFSKTNDACSRFKTKSRIALTGSPLSNSVLEYFAMIEWVAPNFLGPYAEFREIYAAPVERGLYHDSSAADKRRAQMKLKALEQLVAPKVHRRTIAVLKDELPPKQEFILFVPPTEPQKLLYHLYLKGVSKEGGETQAETFAAINHLGLICTHPRCFEAKVKAVQKGISTSGDDDDKKPDRSFPKTMIPDFLKTLQSFRDLDTPSLSLKTELLVTILDEARQVHDKVLIFSQSLHTLDYLQNMCKMQRRSVCRLDGQTPIATRQAQTKDFNEGSKEVFLISTTAGGVGLNIQGANRVVIFDVRYNPSHELQAVGRAYRIGQQKPVFVYRFMVAGTFEDNLHNRQVFKMQLASRVVDKKNPISWSKRKGDVVAEIRYRPPIDLKPYLGKDLILDKLIRLKENGEAIRSIVTTDTFEEEDLGATLTEEENKQVAEMIKLNHLRATNPEEYIRTRDRMELMEQARLYRDQEQLLRVPPPSHQPVNQSFDGASDTIGHAYLPQPLAIASNNGQDQLGAGNGSPFDSSTLVSS